MLTNLHVKNVAIIDELSVSFENGFEVLTGETGAGKSILIDSINMILGERASRELIRHDENKAQITAVFYVSSDISDIIKENFDIVCDDGMLIISREIYKDGRNICKINSLPVTVNDLKLISTYLVDIHGQHDSRNLTDPMRHIDFLDNYGGKSLFETKKEYCNLYHKMKEIKQELDTLTSSEINREQTLDLLSFQIKEIEDISPVLGEDEELSAKLKKQRNMQKILEAMNNAYSLLYNSNGFDAACDAVSSACSSLSSVQDYDEKIVELSDSLADINENLSDIARSINAYISSFDFDLNETNECEERLDTLFRLKRKYGQTIEEVLDFLDNAKKEYDSLTHSDERLVELNNEYNEICNQLHTVGANLSVKRNQTAKILDEAITNELRELNMPNAQFCTCISQTELFTPNGIDKVEFLISANIGEPAKAITKIASGGELSRIMLSMKSAFASTDTIETMIFDEIDTGVSGETAHKIGIKIAKIAKNKQVLCITHLPQIAAFADDHYYISKQSDNGRTTTSVEKLNDNERANAIAKLQGGESVTDTGIELAEELIKNAQSLKQKGL